jgi:uncharacterized protein (TIRG00374 family)
LTRRLVIFICLSLLLWWALRNAPLADIWTALGGLRIWQILLLLGINSIVIAMMTARWWLIVRAETPGAPFLPLVWNRLAVFGISYFTPGPQVGGEPLQVIYLQRNHGFSYARATSTVIMDKLVEFLVNFLLLSVGVWAVLEVGLLSSPKGVSIIGLVGLGIVLVWPVIHIGLLYRKVTPVTAVILAIPFLNPDSRFARLIINSETLAAEFCQRHTSALLASVGVSALAVLGILAEYALMAIFLNINLSLIELFAALTFLQLAFLVPFPGGLGALEASQVFALGVYGYSPAVAISLTLLQRGRDILNGGLGLLIAGRGIPRREE